jgi:transcriptional regulator with XRE-family HTH domain
MIPVRRIAAIFKSKNLTATAAGRIIQLSASKMSKVMAGEQTLTPDAIGMLIKEFNIYPNWLFGYEGNDDEVMFMEKLIPESEWQKTVKEIQDLKNELGEVYKQLAEERRRN